jgi:PBSX family phage terminase large subunit
LTDLDTVAYNISTFQDTFINSDEKRVAIIGAKGSSKTWSGARYLLSEVTRQPRVQHLVMLNTLQQARDVYHQDIEPLLQDLRWPYKFNAQYMNLKIFDTTVHMRSAERDSINKIESIHYGSGWADEASFYDKESLEIFLSRIRKGKSKVRVTSMPDEPDHWLYELLENAGFKMFEISLYDNPDKVFVAHYEEILKSFYDDVQLRRYLSGERVSLAGLGIFALGIEHKGDTHIDTSEDIYLFWDFNVAYRAVSAWQRTGTDPKGRPLYGVVKSWQMKEATVYEDAVVLAEFLKKHRASIYLGGDASENKRSSQTTESMWMTVRRAFRDNNVAVRSIVPRSNPNVKDTIQCCNWCLRQNLVIFDKNEKNVYRSVAAAKADKFGEIDKSGDDRPGGAKSHEADTFRYGCWHFYSKLYPGGKKRIWVV